MSVFLTDLADVLRAAGVKVKEMKYTQGPHAGKSWKYVGYNGMGYSDIPLGIVWHHDASPEGDSPGALDWMMYDGFGAAPAANAWVDRKGVWYLYCGGYSNHAGVGSWPKLGLVNNGNAKMFGIETDHTTGEAWPADQINSLRLGTAAILKHWGRPADNLIGHKEWAPGRKDDPDGLNMRSERRRVKKLMNSDQSNIKKLLDRWFGLTGS